VPPSDDDLLDPTMLDFVVLPAIPSVRRGPAAPDARH
jgi:hypothetical protein